MRRITRRYCSRLCSLAAMVGVMSILFSRADHPAEEVSFDGNGVDEIVTEGLCLPAKWTIDFTRKMGITITMLRWTIDFGSILSDSELNPGYFRLY